jgi:hypothetical protein
MNTIEYQVGPPLLHMLVINNRSIKMVIKNCLALALFCSIITKKIAQCELYNCLELCTDCTERQQIDMRSLRSKYHTQVLIISTKLINHSLQSVAHQL